MNEKSLPANPLYTHDQPPAFDRIKATDVVPAVRELVAQQDRAREALESAYAPTWEGLGRPVGELAEPLSYAWGVVHHLLSVRNAPELRAAEEEVQPEFVGAALRLGQSRRLYDGFVALRDGPAWAALSPARKRIVTS